MCGGAVIYPANTKMLSMALVISDKSHETRRGRGEGKVMGEGECNLHWLSLAVLVGLSVYPPRSA